MKQFLLFTFAEYYPCGGMEDFDSDFDTIDEAIVKALKFINNNDYHNAHIYDIQKREIVWKS